MSGGMMAELKPTVLRGSKCKEGRMSLQAGSLFPSSALRFLSNWNTVWKKERRRGRGKERLFGDSTKTNKRRCAFQRAGSISMSPWKQQLRNRPSASEWNHSNEQASDAYYYVNLRSQMYITTVQRLEISGFWMFIWKWCYIIIHQWKVASLDCEGSCREVSQ